MSPRYRRLLSTIPIDSGLSARTLRLAAHPDELEGIEAEHLARLVSRDDQVVGQALVKRVQRGNDGSSIDLVPCGDCWPAACEPIAIELDRHSRWLHEAPRRGDALPGQERMLPASVRRTSPLISRAHTTPFPAVPRPARDPANIQPSRTAHAEAARTLKTGPAEWQLWRLATATSQQQQVFHSWHTQLNLVAVAAPDQPMVVAAPASGTFEPNRPVVAGRRVEAGTEIGTLHLAGKHSKLLQSTATGDLERATCRRLLLAEGVEGPVIDQLLLRPTTPRIPVFAPVSGFLSTVATAAVRAGQAIGVVEAGAHTMAYGRLPMTLPFPPRVGLDFKPSPGASFSFSALPLREVVPETRVFGLPLPMLAPSVLTRSVMGTIVSSDDAGLAVAIPVDCVMTVHRSSEVLVHGSAYTLVRKPIQVIYRDQQYVYADSLAEGLEVVRDLEVVAKLFPPIGALMLGLVDFRSSQLRMP